MKLVDSAYQQMKKKLSKQDQDLILKFFMVFSRFKRALKYSGFNHTIRYFGPNWRGFIQAIEPRFDKHASQEVKDAFEFLKNNNPNRETMGDWGGIDYEPIQEGDSELMTVIDYLQAVRNNLFHGAKGERGDFIKSKDPQYLTSCLILLNAFLELNETVRQAFFEGLNMPDMQRIADPCKS